MPISNFSIDLTEVNVNGKPIKDWGETDPPFTISPVNPKAVLRPGLGGNAVKLVRKNQIYEATFNINPGSNDSSFLQGQFVTGANISLGYTIVGTLEGAVGIEGVIVNVGDTGRAGMTITDDIFIVQVNVWTQTKGGNA